jgi:hypothetical protein
MARDCRGDGGTAMVMAVVEEEAKMRIGIPAALGIA